MKFISTIITTILSVFISTLCYSQNQYHPVSLAIKTDPIVVNFSCREVIDKRVIRDNIGYVQKGLNNKKVPANLDGKFAKSIYLKVNEMLLRQEDSEKLTLIIHELSISEMTSATSEKGICRVEIEFARKIDSVYYSLGTFYAEKEQAGITDVTKKHGQRIIECLKGCLLEFELSNWKELEGDAIDFNEERQQFDFNSIPKEGTYSSFNKLAKSEPMEAFEKKFVRLSDDKGPDIYKLESVHKADAKKKVMFVSDGTNIYMHSSRYCYQKHFVKAKQLGRYYYFEDQFSDADAAVAFGLLGAAVSLKMRSIILDTSNGEVSILDDTLIQKITTGHPSIFMEYKNSKQKLADKEDLIKKLNEAMNQQ